MTTLSNEQQAAIEAITLKGKLVAARAAVEAADRASQATVDNLRGKRDAALKKAQAALEKAKAAAENVLAKAMEEAHQGPDSARQAVDVAESALVAHLESMRAEFGWAPPPEDTQPAGMKTRL